MRYLVTLFLPVLICFSACGQDKKHEVNMEEKIAEFARTEIKYDHSLLDDNQKVVVEKLYLASKIIDELFLEQVYSRNFQIRDSLRAATDPDAASKLTYFDIMFGPFDRIDDNKPFIGSSPKPDGANFYPEDMTKEEFNGWLEEHPEDRASFMSEFTMIRREGTDLAAIPYSIYFSDKLQKISDYLLEAAEYADNPSLKKYLVTRAEAFLSNDYYESDMAWMDLKDHTIEVVIGPYEVYEDALFNYKAAFESFITLRDPEESRKLEKFAAYLDEMENHLPIPDEHKNFGRGSESPMVVVQEVFSAGDTKAGVQTLAFNLPNDERVREAKGSKKVMLKNIHEAKFSKLLYPIAEIVLEPDQLAHVTFDAFFNHTLMHEMSHGIGPGTITIAGRETTVKNELKETYSKLEECKADILGTYNNIFMIDKGVFSPEIRDEIYCTFLAGIFRSIRFDITEAHGASNAIIFNYLLEGGAYSYNEQNGKVRVEYDKVLPVLKELATKVLMIQALGDYDAARELIKTYAVNSPAIQAVRARLKHLPVDIRPVFEIEKELAGSE